MNKKFTLLTAGIMSFFISNAQVQINESFTAPFTPSTASWVLINNSTPAPVNNWRQGVGSQFAANSGNPNDYFAADWTAAGNATAQVSGISNWLITPTVTIYNGAKLAFATRKVTSNTQYPDRMVVRMSTAGSATAIPTGSASLGTFTTALLDINPLYSNATTSAVANGSVNGYPQTWTVYNLVVSGVTGTVTGRFAFHYFVDNGGGAGANSDAIGIDDVNYSLPCSGTVSSFTTCPSTSVTLVATGVNSGSTYTWNPGGSNATSITVAPAVTTVYSLTLNDNGTPCPVKTGTVTIGSNLSINVTASSSTICAGSNVSLTAMSAATSYTWSTLANGSSIVVTPTTNTTYSVGGSNGTCFGGNTVAIVVNQPPSVTSVSVSGYPTGIVCIGSVPTLTLVASGGVTYSWANPPSGIAGSTLTINTPTAAGNYPITVDGIGANGCGKTATVALVMNNTPTITLAFSGIPTGTFCAGSSPSITLLSSGAVSYNWSPISTSTLGSISIAAPAVGNYTYSVVGTGSNTCTRTASIALNVANCTGINEAGLNSNLLVYPNPFSSEIYVSGIKGTVEVVNMLGQVVLTTSVNENEKINTINFAKGVYFVKVRNEQGVEVKTTKLIKN